MKELEALKALSGTATQFFVVVAGILGIISMILKQVFDKQKKSDDLKEILNSLSSQVKAMQDELAREINENEKQLKELEFTSQRNFYELLKAVSTGNNDALQELANLLKNPNHK